MKLHYSQTTQDPQEEAQIVSVPYEITLLSNYFSGSFHFSQVSVPYEITLLSNLKFQIQVFTK